MTSYLQRQRKADLQEMAGLAGVHNASGMLKEDLVAALQSRLNENPAEYQKVPALKEYYERGGSPSKQRAATSDGEAKPRRRKTVKKEDLESPEEGSPDAAALVKTPARAVQKAAERVSERIAFPPSPAVVADAIERQTTIVTSRVNALLSRSGLSEQTERIRELLSSVHGIEAVIALLEAYALQRQTLPWTTAVKLPAVSRLTDPDGIVHLPNLFEILTAKFWSTTLLWLTTSALLPALFGYFFNLTLPSSGSQSHGHGTRHSTGSAGSSRKAQHSVDPLTFNVTKALISWLVYARGFRFGIFSHDAADRVNYAVFGGYQGILVGAAIGGLASLYDAVLKK